MTSKKQINALVYLSTDADDPKVVALDHLCKINEVSRSSFFRKLYMDYLKREGIVDDSGKFKSAKLKALADAAKKKNTEEKDFKLVDL